MPTQEQAKQWFDVVNNLQKWFYNDSEGVEKQRLAHFIKIGIVAPIDFARRQNGAARVASITSHAKI